MCPLPRQAVLASRKGDAVGSRVVARVSDWLRASPGEIGLVGLLAAVLLAGGAFAYVRASEPGDPPVRPEAEQTAPSSTRMLVVHVSGLVASPGVYQVPEGSRVADAITAAGGAVDGADLHALNLAAIVTDGEKIVVPSVQTQPAEGAQAGSSQAVAAGKVSLNTATKAELEALPSVGPVLAQRIIDYRQKRRFTSTRQLLDIDGFGPKKYAALKDLVTV